MQVVGQQYFDRFDPRDFLYLSPLHIHHTSPKPHTLHLTSSPKLYTLHPTLHSPHPAPCTLYPTVLNHISCVHMWAFHLNEGVLVIPASNPQILRHAPLNAGGGAAVLRPVRPPRLSLPPRPHVNPNPHMGTSLIRNSPPLCGST